MCYWGIAIGSQDLKQNTPHQKLVNTTDFGLQSDKLECAKVFCHLTSPPFVI